MHFDFATLTQIVINFNYIDLIIYTQNLKGINDSSLKFKSKFDYFRARELKVATAS